MAPFTRAVAEPRATSPAARRPARWVRLLSVPLVLAVVAVGVWVTGALVTDNTRIAMLLTTVWFAVTGLLAVLVALRWRSLALPVLATFVVSAAGIGGFLLYSSSVDKVVAEDVVVAPPATRQPAPGASAPAAAPAIGPVTVASGRFRAGAHETTGTARVVQRADGRRVLTLTGFATEPGPDLRVYVVPAGGSGVRGGIDVGRLKGNKGDQQYAVADGVRAGGVVIWCRSFSVAFGSASLA